MSKEKAEQAPDEPDKGADVSPSAGEAIMAEQLGKTGRLRTTFQALHNPSYRLWAGGAFISNIGTWMQRTAQYWLVLKELSEGNAAALGWVMALQSGPQVLLLPWTGYAADSFDRRKILIATQAALGVLALGLGLLAVTGTIMLWHVFVFAALLGCVNALDVTARQTFVSDLVGESDLPNAVALNSTSMTMARMIGPAVAGVLIASVGAGWVFLINSFSFIAVLISLLLLRAKKPGQARHGDFEERALADGFRYVRNRSDLKAVFLMFFLIGTFGLNFPIFISTMSIGAFHVGADRYGALMSLMAVGSVTGALLAAGRSLPTVSVLLASATCFGLSCLCAALMPSYWLFGLMLVFVGICTQTFSTTANSLVQISTAPALRGRVMAILLAIALGCTPIGAPIVGWIADCFGPRWAMIAGASSGFVAALFALLYIRRYERIGIAPNST